MCPEGAPISVGTQNPPKQESLVSLTAGGSILLLVTHPRTEKIISSEAAETVVGEEARNLVGKISAKVKYIFRKNPTLFLATHFGVPQNFTKIAFRGRLFLSSSPASVILIYVLVNCGYRGNCGCCRENPPGISVENVCPSSASNKLSLGEECRNT